MVLYKTIKLAGAAILLAGAATTAHAAELTGGVNVGVFGTGAYVAGDTPLAFSNNDKVRWRASFARLDSDVKNKKFSNNRYSGDLKSTGVQLGLDWYPFENQFFVSGGAVSFDREFDLKIKPEKDFKIGNQKVLASDNISVKTKIDHNSPAPYLSLGWGNKHSSESGFAVFGEVGVMFPTDDADVELNLIGNNGVVSAENLALEKRELEDDLNKTQLVATIGIGYHF